MQMQPSHFVNISDHQPDVLRWIIDKAIEQKQAMRAGTLGRLLEGRTLFMYFQKPSLRTRLSFEVAITQLGGDAVYASDSDVGMGKRESVPDVARVVSSMTDCIVARTFSHDLVEELARYATVPVVNALTDRAHPCQAMTDIMTVCEHFGDLKGRRIAFVGDANNVARSLAILCCKLGIEFSVAAPKGYQFDDRALAQMSDCVDGLKVPQCEDPAEAISNADVVYTDTWISMGQESERSERLDAFEGYQLNDELLAHAPEHAVVMHCLPAYRGYEITDEVMESPRNLSFIQAENRLHLQRTLLLTLLNAH